jgi:hypothetical protein
MGHLSAHEEGFGGGGNYMTTTEIITTCICDRCGARVDQLKRLFMDDIRPDNFQSSYCRHVLLMDLCLGCWGVVLEKIGKKAQETEAKIAEDAKRLRDMCR